MNMSMKIIYLLFLGLISGSVSYFSANIPEIGLWVGPGLVFGVVLGIHFYTKGFPVSRKLFSFILCSVAAYYAAVNITFFSLNIIPRLPVILVVAGFVGSLVLTSCLYVFILPIKNQHLTALVIFGGLLGLSWYLLPEESIFGPSRGYGPAQESLLSLLVFWQMGMMVGIGLATDKKLKKE